MLRATKNSESLDILPWAASYHTISCHKSQD